MLHLKRATSEDIRKRARQEIAILYQNGVDAVLVEKCFGNTDDCQWALAYLKENCPVRIYGVNIPEDTESAFSLADTCGAKFIQSDSVCRHLRSDHELAFVQHLDTLRSNSRALVSGGVRFKHQRHGSAEPYRDTDGLERRR